MEPFVKKRHNETLTEQNDVGSQRSNWTTVKLSCSPRKRPRLLDHPSAPSESSSSGPSSTQNLGCFSFADGCAPIQEESTSCETVDSSLPTVSPEDLNVDALTANLNSWSVFGLKEWRRKEESSTGDPDGKMTALIRNRQKEARKEMIRLLRRQNECDREEN